MSAYCGFTLSYGVLYLSDRAIVTFTKNKQITYVKREKAYKAFPRKNPFKLIPSCSYDDKKNEQYND
jgi:hypothetical protein